MTWNSSNSSNNNNNTKKQQHQSIRWMMILIILCIVVAILVLFMGWFKYERMEVKLESITSFTNWNRSKEGYDIQNISSNNNVLTIIPYDNHLVVDEKYDNFR